MDHHHIYLLHVWTEKREDRTRPVLLRVTLEEPHTGRRWGFNEIRGLVNFLEDVLVAHEEELRDE